MGIEGVSGQEATPQSGGVYHIEGQHSENREAALIGVRDAQELIPELPAGAVEIRAYQTPEGHERRVMLMVRSNGELSPEDVARVNQLHAALGSANTFESMADGLQALRSHLDQEH